MSIKEQITALPEDETFAVRWTGEFTDFDAADLKALADSHTKLLEAAKALSDAWGDSWDCSADPGHHLMNGPQTELIAAIEEAEKLG